MRAISLRTARQVVPMIYAYTTPEIARHDGWIKIGYTEQGVDARLRQQTHTADVRYREEWRGSAAYDDGSGDFFRDTDFHAYLRKLGIENSRENEWFRVSAGDSHRHFIEFRTNRGVLPVPDAVAPFTLREEQARAVEQTLSYFAAHDGGEFLWNAKPRFGKTLAAYELCRRLGAGKVLIVTNRPAIANSWYGDYVRFLGRESGYLFVSRVDALAGKPHVVAPEDYVVAATARPDAEALGRIEFVSLQDLKGSIHFGGEFNKLAHIAENDWDILIIDEAHEGVDTYKTDVALDRIRRRCTLHLSGTPFRALASDKFPADAIFNWTYADEQRAKRDWRGEPGTPNPYADLPRLNLYTYQMSEIVREELGRGVEIDGENERYAFDLGEFFQVKAGRFVHEASVDRFLDALTRQEKFPFSTPELRNEIRHSFWLLDRVDSARALAEKLRAHPVFGAYKVVEAVGDGRSSGDDMAETRRSFDKVRAAIEGCERTITLSVGQLTTGVTIPEWSAVLMLTNMRSPAQYMQAAFRSQNPWRYGEGGRLFRKENAYVFDFDPARTLILYERFANDLCADTADGRGDSERRREHIRELLNFFPVLGEDEKGEMVELDAEKVLTLPRKIKSAEVVRRGFMCDYLFQNIANVFRAPQEVLDIITRFQPVSEPRAELGVTPETAGELSLDEGGEVSLEEGYVIGRSAEVFGERIFRDVPDDIYDALDALTGEEAPAAEDPLARLKQAARESVLAPAMERAKEAYGRGLRPSEQRRFESKSREETDLAISRIYDGYRIDERVREERQRQRLEEARTGEERRALERDFAEERRDAGVKLQNDLLTAIDEVRQSTQREIVRAVETAEREQRKQEYEDRVRDHLRGFARTIPSFLMAYGGEGVTLESFDRIIPDRVFREVTSITLEQFRFLRDGGPYTDSATGEERFFEGRLFDPVVFDDSIQEFLRLRARLADYFSEASEEDIFDYIPPQRTNQIFTPKWVVKRMVDLLEAENPGCFDDGERTFLDPYMKSGLYIAEIVKRLYRSEGMKRRFPDERERLAHIFERQVYGLAPTEIIYRIACNYILGFANEGEIPRHNLRQLNALPCAREGTLEAKLDELFG